MGDPAIIVTLLGNGGVFAALLFLYMRVQGVSEQVEDVKKRIERVENVYFRHS